MNIYSQWVSAGKKQGLLKAKWTEWQGTEWGRARAQQLANGKNEEVLQAKRWDGARKKGGWQRQVASKGATGNEMVEKVLKICTDILAILSSSVGFSHIKI